MTLSIHDQRANLACTLIEDLSPNTIKKKRPSEANKCLLMSMANGMENVACALIDKGFPLNVNAGVFGSVPPNQQPQKSSRFSSTTQKDFNPIPPPSAVLSQVSFPSYFMLSVGIGLENFTKIMAKVNILHTCPNSQTTPCSSSFFCSLIAS